MQEERCIQPGKPAANAYRKDHGSLTDVSVLSDDSADDRVGGRSAPNSPHSVRSGANFKVSDLLTGEDMLPSAKEMAGEPVVLDKFLGAMRAYAVKLIGWAQHIPAFAHLNFENQVRLLKASWCELYVLHLAVHNGSNPDTLVLGGGLTCKPDQIGDPEIPQLINRTTSEVSLWFESLSTEPVELACLKGILLFNPGRWNM